jgi:hypothetical protein
MISLHNSNKVKITNLEIYQYVATENGGFFYKANFQTLG